MSYSHGVPKDLDITQLPNNNSVQQDMQEEGYIPKQQQCILIHSFLFIYFPSCLLYAYVHISLFICIYIYVCVCVCVCVYLYLISLYIYVYIFYIGSNSQNWTWNTDWFQTWKGVCQGCILSSCIFNLYAVYIMRNAELDEAQAGIKISGRNINNLRYADDTTLMAESEEELKNLLMKGRRRVKKLA